MNRISRTEPLSIFFVLCCTFLGATAQILFKMGSNYLQQSGIIGILSNYWLIGGYACYAVSTLLLIIALKKGELSVLYPIIATTYVWVTFLSPMFFHTDSINILKLGGVFCIVAGVTTLGFAGNR